MTSDIKTAPSSALPTSHDGSKSSRSKALSAPAIFSESFWKRFRNGIDEFPVPVVSLDPHGTIQEMSPAARRVLGYQTEDVIDPYFFTHVHGQNMHRVMRDLAQMVKAHTRRTSWLIRLQTRKGRWRWFRVEVVNRLQAIEQCIVLRLRSA